MGALEDYKAAQEKLAKKRAEQSKAEGRLEASDARLKELGYDYTTACEKLDELDGELSSLEEDFEAGMGKFLDEFGERLGC